MKIKSHFIVPGILMMALVQFANINKLSAQETGYFTHQFLQPILINPGATGFNEDHQAMATYKHSYSDFSGAPRTFTALYHGSFADKV